MKPFLAFIFIIALALYTLAEFKSQSVFAAAPPFSSSKGSPKPALRVIMPDSPPSAPTLPEAAGRIMEPKPPVSSDCQNGSGRPGCGGQHSDGEPLYRIIDAQ